MNKMLRHCVWCVFDAYVVDAAWLVLLLKSALSRDWRVRCNVILVNATEWDLRQNKSESLKRSRQRRR